MISKKNGVAVTKTRFSERKIFRSSIHIKIGDIGNRSIDEGSESGELPVDPNTRLLVTPVHSGNEAQVFSDQEAEKVPEFTCKPKRQLTNVGDRTTFIASFNGSPATELTWSFNGKVLTNDGRHRIYMDEDVHILEITETKPEDGGSYVCKIENVAGSATMSADLEVIEPADTMEPPVFTKELQDMDVNDGDRVEMSVEVQGTPPIDIVWVHENREIPPSDPVCRMITHGKTHMLVILEVFPEDAGKYTCEAYNDYGDTVTFCRLNVHEEKDSSLDISQKAPEFIVQLQALQVSIGTNVVLKCQVSGKPPPFVIWRKGRQTLEHCAKYLISSIGNEHFLQISSATLDDSGHYTCTLCNSAGTAISMAQLTVEEIVKRETSQYSSSNINHSEHRIKSQGNCAYALPGVSSECFAVTWSKNEQVCDKNAVKSNIDAAVKKSSGIIQTDFSGVLKNKNTNKHHTDIASNKHHMDIASNKHHTDIASNKHHTDIASNKHHTDIASNKHHMDIASNKHHTDIASNKHHTDIASNKHHMDIASNKHHTDIALNSKSKQLLNAQDLPKHKTEYLRQDLAQKKKVFELGNAIDKRIQKNNNSDKKEIGKVSDVLKKFEGNTPAMQSDFQNVLKLRDKSSLCAQNKASLVKVVPSEQRDDHQLTQIDFRSVLKQRKDPNFKSESQKADIKKLAETKLQRNIAKQELSLILNTVTSQMANTINIANDTTDCSNITSMEMGKNKPNDSNCIEIVKPIPKGLSQTSKVQPVFTANSKNQTVSQNSKCMDVQPIFTETLKNQPVMYESQVVMVCKASATPPDTNQSSNFQTSHTYETARLAEVFSEDESDYICQASNKARRTELSCHLPVQDHSKAEKYVESDNTEEPFSPTATPPKIYNISPAAFCMRHGETIELKASFTSVPAGLVRWYKDGQLIQTGYRMTIKTSEHFSALTITNIQRDDSGEFSIKVENQLGADSACSSITVEDVPEPPAGQPCVSEVTYHTAVLSWCRPYYDGGCPVTNYRVEMCDAEEQEWILIKSDCLSTTYKIENLTPHTPYFFRVFAENKHGLSAPCQTLDVVVTSDRQPSALLSSPSSDSDDVFICESHDVCTAMTWLTEYGIVSPLSPDEVPFDHKEVRVIPGRKFEHFYNCLQEVGNGKFGNVHKCEEKVTGKIWAAKILKCREPDKKKIHLEIEIMNKLKHPKILQLWDAFEEPRRIILVMEYIGGGELFERVIDDDFELTECDCIQFMRQICDAVCYMHACYILHLDLKPENILCIKDESNKIKIIDFGLAKYYKKGESVRVLFGTPEFIAPEVVNYDEISFTTDMWSVGVISYVLLTGYSPFMGDSDAETLANVTKAEYDLEIEEFNSVSADGKDFIEKLLIRNQSKRMTSQEALKHRWLTENAAWKTRRINTRNLKRFMARRKWQKTGHALCALGRMTNLLKLQTTNGNDSQDQSLFSDHGKGSSISSSSSLSSSGSQNTLYDPKTSSNSLKENSKEEVVWNGGNVAQTLRNVSNEDMRKGNYQNETIIKGGCHMGLTSNLTKLDFNSIESLTGSGSSLFERLSNQHSKNDDIESRPVIQNKMCEENSSQNQNNAKTNCPRFVKKMVDSKSFTGDAVRFDVAYASDDTVQVLWYFENGIFHQDERHYIQEGNNRTCSLIIKNVCEDDDGEYSCKIVNNAGEDICSAELIVYGPI